MKQSFGNVGGSGGNPSLKICAGIGGGGGSPPDEDDGGMGGSGGSPPLSIEGGGIGGVPPACDCANGSIGSAPPAIVSSGDSPQPDPAPANTNPDAAEDPFSLPPENEPMLRYICQLKAERFLVTGMDLLNVSRMYWGPEGPTSAMDCARRHPVPKWATHFSGYAVNPDAKDLNEVFGELEHLQELPLGGCHAV